MSDEDILRQMAAAGLERTELRTEKHKASLANLEELNSWLAEQAGSHRREATRARPTADASIDSSEKDIAKLREQLEKASQLTGLLVGYDKRQQVQLLKTLATWLDAMSWEARALAATDEMILLVAEIESEDG